MPSRASKEVIVRKIIKPTSFHICQGVGLEAGGCPLRRFGTISLGYLVTIATTGGNSFEIRPTPLTQHAERHSPFRATTSVGLNQKCCDTAVLVFFADEFSFDPRYTVASFEAMTNDMHLTIFTNAASLPTFLPIPPSQNR
jgi:hypothetical protein